MGGAEGERVDYISGYCANKTGCWTDGQKDEWIN